MAVPKRTWRWFCSFGDRILSSFSMRETEDISKSPSEAEGGRECSSSCSTRPQNSAVGEGLLGCGPTEYLVGIPAVPRGTVVNHREVEGGSRSVGTLEKNKIKWGHGVAPLR